MVDQIELGYWTWVSSLSLEFISWACVLFPGLEPPP